jgi:hypothetical protein
LNVAYAARTGFGRRDEMGEEIPRRGTWIGRSVGIVLLLAFLAVNAHRTELFVREVAAQHAALPRKLERLGAAIRCLDRAKLVPEAATASHEINYLLAYWSNANLLLPEGFPLQNAESNTAIEQATADLLHLYGATSDRWRSFAVLNDAVNVSRWERSRVLAERHGYLYHLFHWDGHRDFRGHVERIAELLHRRQDQGLPTRQPRVIIVDKVARYFRGPDTTGYIRLLQSEDIDLWFQGTGLDPAVTARAVACGKRSAGE